MDELNDADPADSSIVASRDKREPATAHPSGRIGHGLLTQVIRGVTMVIYFITGCFLIFITQNCGIPLYWFNREWFYAHMALTKRHFSLLIILMTQIWGSTTIRISGDASVAGEIKPAKRGGVVFSFPERMVMVANHQIYTDWIYLWWTGYVNVPQLQGYIYIIMKESLKYIPILGTGMMLYGFIFMSRKMATDQPRMAYRLGKLRQYKVGPKGEKYLDPMWLLLFPEGTNLAANGHRRSVQWAEKNGLRSPEHVLLPRSTGTFFCLNELKGTVDYVYDCTVAYEGIPRGKYGEHYFGLGSTYLQGRAPKSVNLYWRKFHMDDIPLHDQQKFDVWLRNEWYKKDDLMEEYLTTGRFPAMAGATTGHIETTVRLHHVREILQLLTVPAIVWLMWNNITKVTHFVSSAAAGRATGHV
ncbi:hypothetical protein CDD81_6237 [Ophiocordyceps australis]|uniref:Phospholipid/glycerol acyltransferase domain-containing protein n=1 Tax=Ophiocordyceps australis TaxID=1399860 RepID=A0A2C5Y657_9HYPO|nr:hypothetical protein CDD81_6237 [Ophiocordyceps australis]